MKYIEIIIKGKPFLVKAEEIKNQIWFHFKGQTFVINKQEETKDPKKSPSAKGASLEPLFNGQIVSPMPGKIVKVCVKVGQRLEKNQTVLVLSSMKMEYTILTPVKGLVKSIKTKVGKQVALQELLMEVKPNWRGADAAF